MIALAFDENFNNDILRGILRRNPAVDVVRVQDSQASGEPDEIVLEWAARNKRVVISHDVDHLEQSRICTRRRGKSMPGLFQVPRSVPLSVAIDDLILIAECSQPGEWEGQVRYLPLR